MSRLVVAAPSEPLAELPGLEFEPGTNLHGALALADWRFLLPSLTMDRMLFVGVPVPDVVRALASTARNVVVVSADQEELQRLRTVLTGYGCLNVHVVRSEAPHTLPFTERSFDLIALGEDDVTDRLLKDARSPDVLASLLAPDGTIYLPLQGRMQVWRSRSWTRRLGRAGVGPPTAFWLVGRRSGGFQFASVLEHVEAARYAFDHVFAGVSLRTRLLQIGGRAACRLGLHVHLQPARALFIRRQRSFSPRSAQDSASGVHHWTTADRSAATAGERRIAFFARGGYDSNKVAFFVFSDERRVPDVLVKMTRSPRYNHRLETEHRALLLLRDGELAEPGSFPAPRFFGHHHDLAVLAQDVVHGAPFRTKARAIASCPLAASGLAWLEELGARSSERRDEAVELAQVFDRLLERFLHLYTLTPAEQSFLGRCIDDARHDLNDVPRVFQHGDAGTWNAMVTADGRIAFLDWEVARPRGVPLWDLFDFLQSFGAWAARVHGERDRLHAYASYFAAATPFSELQARTVRRYCARIGIPERCIEPLFFACWMQRAVREAAWTNRPMDDGFYVNLVRRCIRHRGAGGLRLLWSHG